MTATDSRPASGPARAGGLSDPALGESAGRVPDARRHRRPGWRDPRLLVGVLIVAASVLVGVSVLSGADDTVRVWALDHELPSGARLTTDDVRGVRVRFTSAEDADRYLSADRSLPRGAVLSRALGAGEMVPRGALTGGDRALVEVPLAVGADDLPATVREGSVVDVWVTPQTATDAARLATATRILDGVVVVGVPAGGDTLAPDGTRQVIVGVPRDQADTLGSALGRVASGRVFLTKKG